MVWLVHDAEFVGVLYVVPLVVVAAKLADVLPAVLLLTAAAVTVFVAAVAASSEAAIEAGLCQLPRP